MLSRSSIVSILFLVFLPPQLYMFAISTNRGVTSCFVVHASSFIGTPLSAYSKRLANRSRKVSLKFSNKSESTFTSAKARNSSYRGHNRAFTPKIVTSELYAASGPSLQVGDDVRIKSDYFNKDGKDGFVQGTVVDVRGGGWYSIEVDGNISKQRGSRLQRISNNISANNDFSNSQPKSDMSSKNRKQGIRVSSTSNTDKIIDLDMLMNGPANQNDKITQEVIKQYKIHSCYKQWVVFTDLHVSPSTLETCLEVLDYVYECAKSRNAGILFLGDFWHHRGTVRVDCLNAVLNKLQTWDLPMLMIPGNHDQVTLGGLEHGLTPFKFAYRIQSQEKDNYSCFGPMIFDYPTKFMGALFVPYVRSPQRFSEVLQSRESKQSNALFVHADVSGALMNDQIVSSHGVNLSAFPPNKPIYSGHFHKPHNVSAPLSSPGVSIWYLGSPYETSLSEAGQNKGLVVLESTQWSCIEKIPIDIGRKHFRYSSCQRFLESDVITSGGSSFKAGDRVVITVPRNEILCEGFTGQNSLFASKVKQLRTLGVKVEIREMTKPNLFDSKSIVRKSTGDPVLVEDMSPNEVLSAYILSEIKKGHFSEGVADDLIKHGTSLLDDLVNPESAINVPACNILADDNTDKSSDIILEKVTIEGFGPFKKKLTYPLNNRGLVLLRGTNLDGGADSNGSGKSTLAMSTLWALSGSLDPRPMQDSKVVDIIHDSSKEAIVSVMGKVNSIPFEVIRTKKKNKSGLTFIFNGNDCSKQAVKDTQNSIEESLGVSSAILARTIFNGQHALNGLLEASDGKLKEELSLVTPLSVWQVGATTARTMSRTYAENSTSFEAQILLRRSDLEKMDKKLFEVESKLEHRKLESQNASTHLDESIYASLDEDKEKVQESIKILERDLALLESELFSKRSQKIKEINEAKLYVDKVENSSSLAFKDLTKATQAYVRAESALTNTQTNYNEAKQKWDGFDSEQNKPICPLCKTPLSSEGVGHSHSEMLSAMEEELAISSEKLIHARSTFENCLVHKENIAKMSNDLANKLKLAKQKFGAKVELWNDSVQGLENQVSETKHQLLLKVNVLSENAMLRQERVTRSVAERSIAESQSMYDALLEETEAMRSQLNALECKGESAGKRSKVYSSLAEIFGPRRIQSFVLQNTVQALESMVQKYLDDLSDGTQRLELSLDDSDRIIRRARVLNQNGSWVERPISSLSGGQFRRCSLAMTLGFAEVVSRKGRLRSNILVLDEPLTHLDRSGRESVGSALKSILSNSDDNSVSTILLILQDLAAEEIEEAFDCIDEVVKQEGDSYVNIDGEGLIDDATEGKTL